MLPDRRGCKRQAVQQSYARNVHSTPHFLVDDERTLAAARRVVCDVLVARHTTLTQRRCADAGDGACRHDAGARRLMPAPLGCPLPAVAVAAVPVAVACAASEAMLPVSSLTLQSWSGSAVPPTEGDPKSASGH